jgi:hypothetical protein
MQVHLYLDRMDLFDGGGDWLAPDQVERVRIPKTRAAAKFAGGAVSFLTGASG